MLNIIRILAALIILTGWSYLSPVGSAHIVPIDQPGGAAGRAPASEATCPLRAWPYIG